MTAPSAPTATDAELIWQQCLFAFEEPSIDTTFATLTRTWLDDDSWIDYAPQWLHGADRIFGELIAVLPWQQREVTMYDRRLPEPRLTAWWDTASEAVEGVPILTMARTMLSHHYSRPFDSIGFNLYRDGHDSVAWHSDRERYELEDPTVAIVSTGQPRSFHVRRRGGGPSQSWQLGHGDLFVMGGSCQHDWEHCVPKVAMAGPRLSIMFRHNMADTEMRD